MQYTQATLAGQPIRLANLFFSGHTKAEIPGVGSFFYKPESDALVGAWLDNGEPGKPELDTARHQELLDLLREHTRQNLHKWTAFGDPVPPVHCQPDANGQHEFSTPLQQDAQAPLTLKLKVDPAGTALLQLLRTSTQQDNAGETIAFEQTLDARGIDALAHCLKLARQCLPADIGSNTATTRP